MRRAAVRPVLRVRRMLPAAVTSPPATAATRTVTSVPTSTPDIMPAPSSVGTSAARSTGLWGHHIMIAGAGYPDLGWLSDRYRTAGNVIRQLRLPWATLPPG